MEVLLTNQFQHPPFHGLDQVPLPFKLLLMHGIPPLSLLLLLLQHRFQQGSFFLTPVELLLERPQFSFLCPQLLLTLCQLEPISRVLRRKWERKS